MLPYNEYQEFIDRYHKSVVIYDDLPYYVNNVLPELKFSGWIVGDKPEEKSVSCRDPLLRDHPFNLGYMNSVILEAVKDGEYMNYQTAAYIQRRPVRRFKQGLTAENLKFSAGNFTTALRMTAFRDMFAGKYPSYNDAVKKLKGKVRSVAFSRRLAVELDELDEFSLKYRGQLIGRSDDPKKFRLGKKFDFLREVLEEQGIAA